MSIRTSSLFGFKGKSVAVAAAIAVLSGGCMTLPQPMQQPDLAPEALQPPSSIDNDFVDIDAGFESGDMFMLKPLGSPGAIPDKNVAPFSLNEVGVYDTLRMLVADTGLALNIEGGTRGGENYGAVSMFDVHGKLQDVLDTLSESMGFFYSVRKNTLHIEPDRQFVISLPPSLSDDSTAGLTNTLQFLGAKETYIDRLNRSLVFRANRQTLAKVETYMNNVRETRSMIIYAMNIFQVDLKHNSDTGIQWNKAGWTTAPGAAVTTTAGSSAGAAAGSTVGNTAGSAAATAAAIGKSAVATGTGLGVGMVLSSANFNIDMLVNFLKTQGTVKAISQPRIGVMNGSRGTFSVGQTLTYVSKVGTTFATSLNQITTETKDLKTGVDIGVYGDVSDNTVYTHLDLRISDLVKINKYTALGTDLTLPQTVNRDLNTIVRARPGDMILVGGITINRDSREDNSGLSKNGVSTEVTRSEMVLALKTKVVNFLPKKKTQSQQPVATSEPAPAAAVTVMPVQVANVPVAPAQKPAVEVRAQEPVRGQEQAKTISPVLPAPKAAEKNDAPKTSSQQNATPDKPSEPSNKQQSAQVAPVQPGAQKNDTTNKTKNAEMPKEVAK